MREIIERILRSSRCFRWVCVASLALVLSNCNGCGDGGGKPSKANIAVLNCLEDQVVLSSKVCDPSQFPISIQASFYPMSEDSLEMGLAADKFVEDNECATLGRSVVVGSQTAYVDSISAYTSQCNTARDACDYATSSDGNGCTYHPPIYDTSYSFNSSENSSCDEVEECNTVMEDSTYWTSPCDTCPSESHSVKVPREHCEWVVPDACEEARQSCKWDHSMVTGCTRTIDTTDGYSTFSETSNSSCQKESAAKTRQTLLAKCVSNTTLRDAIFAKLKAIGKQTYTYTLNGCDDLEKSFRIGPVEVPAKCELVEKDYDSASVDDDMKVVDGRTMEIIECSDTAISIGKRATDFDSNGKPIIEYNMVITDKFTKVQYVDSVKIELSANLGESSTSGTCSEDRLMYWNTDSSAFLQAMNHPFEYSCNLWKNANIGDLFRDSVSCETAPSTADELYCGCYTPIPIIDTTSVDVNAATARCKLVDSWGSFDGSPSVSEYGAAQDSGFSKDAKAYSIECSGYGDSTPSSLSLISSIDTLKSVALTKSEDKWKSGPIILSWNVVDKALAPSRILRVLPAGGSWGLPVGVKLSTPDGLFDYNVCSSIQTVPLRFHFTMQTGVCGPNNWHSLSDSLLKMANALWSQECVRFTLESSDSVIADFATDGIAELMTQCNVNLIGTPSQPEGCKYDATYGGPYNFRSLPKSVAYGGNAYLALQDSFSLKFSQDSRIIDVVYLDAILTMFTENSTVTAAGLAMSQKAKMYESQNIQNAFGTYADSISAPIVFLGCNANYNSFVSVLAHELGHIATGRGHVTEITSIMHAQDASISFWPGYELIGLSSGTASGLQQYLKSAIRTSTLQFGATGTNDFNGDY